MVTMYAFLFLTRKFTLCIVFYHWRNRLFSILKKNSNNNSNLLSLFYSSSSNQLILSVNNLVRSTSLLSSFSGKKNVLWLAQDNSKNITKSKINNYISELILQTASYFNEQLFTFTTQDGVLSKIMFSTNFYDTDSEQYHKVLLQEKLDGSYVI